MIFTLTLSPRFNSPKTGTFPAAASPALPLAPAAETALLRLDLASQQFLAFFLQFISDDLG